MKGILEFIYKFAHAVNLAHGGYPTRIHFEQSNPSGQYSKTSLILCSWACCFGDWKRKLDRKIDLTNHSITSFWRFGFSFILETRWTGDDALSTWEPLEGPNGLLFCWVCEWMWANLKELAEIEVWTPIHFLKFWIILRRKWKKRKFRDWNRG